MLLKIGELARQTGLSVRTLHYYDEIELLHPSSYSGAGHRLYTTRDVERLQNILSLRQLGLSLKEIGECLENPEFSPVKIIELHLKHLREQMHKLNHLYHKLEQIYGHLVKHEDVTGQDLIQLIQEVAMFEKYYTPEQLAKLKERAGMAGEERMKQVPQEWADLRAKVEAAMNQNLDPTQEPVLSYARKWQSLIDEFTGGDPGIEQSLRNLYANEPSVHTMHGSNYSPEICAYIGKALEIVKKEKR